jgi:hypothetical protein
MGSGEKIHRPGGDSSGGKGREEEECRGFIREGAEWPFVARKKWG